MNRTTKLSLSLALALFLSTLVVMIGFTATASYAYPTVNADGSCPPGIAKRKPWLCPTPSPSVSTSVSPTVSPSTSSSSVSPSPSSISPSPSPSPSPTLSPSPTPTSSGCMPVPSNCGWPDATNTGLTVPVSSLQVVTGDVWLGTAGSVYENKDIRGCISVRAKNITIRNVRITCPSWYAIGVNTGSPNIWNAPDANLLIEDTEINLGGSWEIKGIGFDGYTARRVHFYGGADCAHFGQNVTIQDSFCEIPTGGPADGPHYDGFQSDGGRNIKLIHNTVRVPYGQTSAILMSTNTSPIYDVSIVNNLVAGGGYTIYCGTSSGGPVQGSFTFTGNRISRIYFPNGGYWGPVTSCPPNTNNVGWTWD